MFNKLPVLVILTLLFQGYAGYDGGYNSCGGDGYSKFAFVVSIISLSLYFYKTQRSNVNYKFIRYASMIVSWLFIGYVASLFGYAEYLVSNGDASNVFNAMLDQSITKGCKG